MMKYKGICYRLRKFSDCFKEWLDRWSLSKLTMQIALIAYLIAGLYTVYHMLSSGSNHYHFALIFLGGVIAALIAALTLPWKLGGTIRKSKRKIIEETLEKA